MCDPTDHLYEGIALLERMYTHLHHTPPFVLPLRRQQRMSAEVMGYHDALHLVLEARQALLRDLRAMVA